MKNFTKKLSVLIASFAMLMGVGLVKKGASETLPVDAAEEKITDYTKITSGNEYFIGATASGTDYYFKAFSNTASSTSDVGQYTDTLDEASSVILEGSGTTWSIKIKSSGLYIAIKTSKDNGRHLIQSAKANFTVSNDTSKNLIKFANGDYCFQFNTTTNQYRFGSYKNTMSNIWLLPVEPSITKIDIVPNSVTIELDDMGLIKDLFDEVSIIQEESSKKTFEDIVWESDNPEAFYVEGNEYMALKAAESVTLSAKIDDIVYGTATIRIIDRSQPVMESIEVSGEAKKRTQYVGQEFDPTGLVFTPKFDKEGGDESPIDGSTIQWDELVAGQEVTGHYKGVIVTVTTDLVEIKDDYVAKIDLSGDFETKEYAEGVAWNPKGLTITATYASEKTDKIDLTDEKISFNYSPDKPKVNTDFVTVTVTYDGKVTSNELTITGINVRQAKNTYNISGSYYIKSNGYYLSSNGTKGAPKPVTSKSSATLLTFTLVDDDTFEITDQEGNILYSTSSNDGVRLGSTKDTWRITGKTTSGSGIYTLQDTEHNRYMVMYHTQDFRTYTNTTTNHENDLDLERGFANASDFVNHWKETIHYDEGICDVIANDKSTQIVTNLLKEYEELDGEFKSKVESFEINDGTTFLKHVEWVRSMLEKNGETSRDSGLANMLSIFDNSADISVVAITAGLALFTALCYAIIKKRRLAD